MTVKTYDPGQIETLFPGAQKKLRELRDNLLVAYRDGRSTTVGEIEYRVISIASHKAKGLSFSHHVGVKDDGRLDDYRNFSLSGEDLIEITIDGECGVFHLARM